MQNKTNTNNSTNTDAKEILKQVQDDREHDTDAKEIRSQVQDDNINEEEIQIFDENNKPQDDINNIDEKDEQKILEIFSDCGLLFEGILEKLNVDKSDKLFMAILRNSLIRQAKDAVIISAFKNADKNQLKKLKGFIKTNDLQFPFASHETAVFELLLSNEELKQKAFADLNKFFKNFIERFNRFSEI